MKAKDYWEEWKMRMVAAYVKLDKRFQNQPFIDLLGPDEDLENSMARIETELEMTRDEILALAAS